MENKPLALAAGFVAMLLVGASYFFPKKNQYLFFQASGIVFLILSYLFDEEYFAMIGLGVALARTITYFALENKDVDTPVWLGLLFSLLTIAAYVVVNLCILKTAKPIDIICLLSLVGFAMILCIRDLEKVRLLVLIPIALSILYNALSGAAAFITISYSFEFMMSVLAIFKYQIIDKKQTENDHEKH